MNYQVILEEIVSELNEYQGKGEVASYIPELAKVNPDKFAVCLTTLDGDSFQLGDSGEAFSIQSISKVLALTLAFQIEGDQLWKRVGVEPSGNSFNSLVQLEYEEGIPRNPLINPGAMVISDILISRLDNPEEEFLQFVRQVSGNKSINYNEKVAASEQKHGHRNAALINLMKSFGNIHNDVERVLEFYFHQCSLEISCQELAQTFLLYAGHGSIVSSGKEVITVSKAKRINAIMQTCGFYDESGDFTFKVGLPGKSGVGGGIAAVYPGSYSVAVWSPRLNEKGNSVLGMKFLELLTTKTKSSIF